MTLFKKLNFPTPFSFGGGAISGEGGGYGFGSISEDESIELLQYAFQKGICIFDTAPIYGFGTSEVRIGKAFKNQREDVFIVSKSGVDWHENKRVNMTNDPIIAEKMLNESLDRLQTDYIDLYMVHWPDEKYDIRKPLEVLKKAQYEGKIKHIGLCNTNLDDLQKASEVCKVDVVQNEFNYFSTDAKSLFPYLKEQNISFMSYGTFDKGILTGRVDEKRTFDSNDARASAPWWKKQDKTWKYQKVREIKEQIKPKSLSQFAIEHNLSFPEVDTLIIGFRNKEQLDDIFNT